MFLKKHPEAFGPWPLLAFMMSTFSKRPRCGQKVAVQISPCCSLNLPFYLFTFLQLASFRCVIEMPRSCVTQSKAHNHFLICVCPAQSPKIQEQLSPADAMKALASCSPNGSPSALASCRGTVALTFLLRGHTVFWGLRYFAEQRGMGLCLCNKSLGQAQ